MFFSHMKSEDLKFCIPSCQDDLVSRVNHYIEFYNCDRPQLKLNGMTPNEYRNHA
nr:IS3 family transposase [Clostridium sp. 'deep sea']